MKPRLLVTTASSCGKHIDGVLSKELMNPRSYHTILVLQVELELEMHWKRLALCFSRSLLCLLSSRSANPLDLEDVSAHNIGNLIQGHALQGLLWEAARVSLVLVDEQGILLQDEPPSDFGLGPLDMSAQLSLIDDWRFEQGEEVVPRGLLKVRDPLVPSSQHTPLRLIITLP